MGLIGAALLFFGAFAPIVSIPIAGSQNYFQNGHGDGVVIVVIAAIAAMLAIAARYKGLLFAGGAALAVLIFTFVNFQMRLSEMKDKMATDLAGNPFRGLADVAVGSVQLQWGWAVLVIGGLVLLGAGATSSRSVAA